MDNPFLLLHPVGTETRGDICTCTQCTPKVFPSCLLGSLFSVLAPLARTWCSAVEGDTSLMFFRGCKFAKTNVGERNA